MERKLNPLEVYGRLCGSLLHKIRGCVRMITMEIDDDYSKIELFCYLDQDPEAIDYELMDDALEFFCAVDNFLMTKYNITIELSSQTLMELSAGRDVLYARYEQD
jgi:hypothetical protein